jgi:NAD(P)-dependent dehydrogenase (short-subunit alcohol dehydrogenase family)
MPPSLTGKVAVVTGGSGGIGRAIITRFLEEGAPVASIDLRPLSESLARDHRVLALTADVTDQRQTEAAIRSVVDQFGAIHVLINGAATITPVATVVELLPEQWEKSLRIDLTSAFLVTRTGIPHLKAAGGGAIVNIASELRIAGSPGRAAYGSAKAALIHLTRVLALDHATDGIRVNALSPGAVPTERLLSRYGTAQNAEAALKHLYPIGRLGRPEEIAAAALFLASDESSFMTGANLVVDGGYTAQ